MKQTYGMGKTGYNPDTPALAVQFLDNVWATVRSAHSIVCHISLLYLPRNMIDKFTSQQYKPAAFAWSSLAHQILSSNKVSHQHWVELCKSPDCLNERVDKHGSIGNNTY